MTSVKWVAAGATVAVLTVWSVPATTQTTTCPAGTTSGTVKSNTPFYLYWCAPSSDVLTGANAYGLVLNPTPVQNLTIVGGPFADGLVQWRGVFPALPKGTYSLTLTDVTAVGESGRSVPFALGVTDPLALPATPIRLRVS